MLLANLGAGTAALDEETPAHCEQTLEFMTTCLIVNEPPQFVHILGMIFDLMTSLSRAAETSGSAICSSEVKGIPNYSKRPAVEDLLADFEIPLTSSAVFVGSLTRVATSLCEIIPTTWFFSSTTGIRRT